MDYNTSAGYRVLTPGGERYDKYFPKVAEPKTFIVHKSGGLEESLELIQDTAARYRSQTAAISRILEGKDLKETCRNVWAFCYSFIQYKLDEPNREQIRKPARTWHDRLTGVDCDCFSVFVSSILLNLGINHYFKVTDYGSGYQHIYVVVPKDGKSRENAYIIDPVLPSFDIEKTPIKQSKYIFMTVELLGNPGFGDKELLEQQLRAVEANPQMFDEYFDVDTFTRQARQVLEVWENEYERNRLLEQFGGGLSGWQDDSELDDMLGNIVKKAVAKIAPKTTPKAAVKAVVKSIAPKPKPKVTADPKNSAPKPAPKPKPATPKTAQNTKNLFQKIKDKVTVGDGKLDAKDIAHNLTRLLPITVVMRNGFLLFLKIPPIKKMLNRLYSDPSKAKFVQDLEKWYYGAGGDPKKLKEAAALNGIDGLGEPVTLTALAATAAPMVTVFLTVMHKAGLLKAQPPTDPSKLGDWLAENSGEIVGDMVETIMPVQDGGDEFRGKSGDMEVYDAAPLPDEFGQRKIEEGKGIKDIIESPWTWVAIVAFLYFFVFKASGGKGKSLSGVKRRKKRRKALGDVETDEGGGEDDGLGGTKRRAKTKAKPSAKQLAARRKFAAAAKARSKAAKAAKSPSRSRDILF